MNNSCKQSSFANIQGIFRQPKHPNITAYLTQAPKKILYGISKSAAGVNNGLRCFLFFVFYKTRQTKFTNLTLPSCLTHQFNCLTLYPSDIFLAVGAYSTPTRWLEGQILRTNAPWCFLARTSNKPSSSVYEFAL